MPEFTHIELAAARKASGIPQWRVGNETGASESQIKRWESGEAIPSPDNVDSYCKAIGRPEIWHLWMCSHYDSYRERYRHKDVSYVNDLLTAVSRVKYELGDVLTLHDSAVQSIVTGTIGKIEDRELTDKIMKEASEAQAALLSLIEILKAEDCTKE